MSKDNLIIFDTTLRDGEQSPGASMTSDEKVRIAKALEKMRVDVIEAGFPIASDGDFEAVKAVAKIVAGFAPINLIWIHFLAQTFQRVKNAGFILRRFIL